MTYALAMYDIACNRRRARLSDLLIELGPRVQQSVFELDINKSRALAALRSSITNVIDPAEDQVRLYQLPAIAPHRTIIGNRTFQERIPYLIL